MGRRVRRGVMAVAAVVAGLAGCAGDDGRADRPVDADAPAPGAGDGDDPVTVIEPGCHVRVTGDRTASLDVADGPGLVASDHWFTTGELADLGEGYGALLVSCVGADADLALWADDLAAVPYQPGTYDIGPDGAAPGAPFAARGRIGEEGFHSSGGSVVIERFDGSELRAVAHVPMVSDRDAAVTVEVTVTVALACSGVSSCAAAPATTP